MCTHDPLVYTLLLLLIIHYSTSDYSYFHERYGTVFGMGFYDPDLRMNFLKANLICNSCNGFLLGDDVACKLDSSLPNCGHNRSADNYVWQSVYFTISEKTGITQLKYSLFSEDDNLANQIHLRNPLFVMSSPCFTAGLDNNSSELSQKSCSQQRPFGCQFATFATVGSRVSLQSSKCYLEDICISPISVPEANVGCPYLLDYKTQINYKNSRIINGEVVSHIEHPWVVKMYSEFTNGEKSVCGGSIVSGSQIVTARHCFGGEQIKSGDISYSTPLGTEVVTFTNNDVTILDSCDIAVVSLPQPILFSKYAMPIKIPEVNEEPHRGEWVSVSGYGAWCDRQIDKSCSQQDEFRLSEQLRSVYITIKKCIQPKVTPQLSQCFDNGHICAGGEQIDSNESKTAVLGKSMFQADACEGDSGGPLECFTPLGVRYLCGIVSYGPAPPDCGSSPGAYTKTSHPINLNFITENTNVTATVRTDTAMGEFEKRSSYHKKTQHAQNLQPDIYLHILVLYLIIISIRK